MLNPFTEKDQDVVAIRETVVEWRVGDTGLPLAEAFDEVRRGREEARGE
jgi:hypothetical protein